MRRLEIGRQPEQFFEAYEEALRGMGYLEWEIQALAGVLNEVYFGLRLMGPLRGNPDYQGKDKLRRGFSCYVFADTVVAGYYSSSPDLVYLDYITFCFNKETTAEALIAYRNRTVHFAA